MINLMAIHPLNKFGFVAIVVWVIFTVSPAQALETVTLQLKWLHQFQFAGYYAAKAKGYYRDAGLEVNFIEAKPGKAVIDSVLDGTAQYGVDVTRLLLARSEGKPVVALGVIFQHSPYILVTRHDSPTQNIHDLAGKRLMLEEKADDVLAYLKKEGLPNDRYTLVKHNFNPQDLVDGKVDAISAYSTNELFFLDKAGFRYQAYTPRSVGIDFYGDTLFTTEQELKNHPSRVKAFRDASLRGWKYAMANPEEIADLIIAQYSQRKSREHLLFEARQMAALIQPDLIELGYMNPGRWRHIADTYVDLGMLPRNFSFGGFIYDSDPGRDNTQIVNLAMMLGICLIGAIIFVVLLRQQVRRKTRTIVESAEQYQTILQSTPDGFWSVGRDGRLVDVNDCYVEFSGYSREELIGMPVEQLEAHDSAHDVHERINTLVNDGFIRFESQHKRKDGIIWDVEVSASYLPAKNEMIVFLRDITESKQAGKLIKVSEERLRAIMDNADSVIYMKDIESKYITINRKFEELFKVNRWEAVGKTDYDIFPTEIAAVFQESDQTVLKLGKPLSLEEMAPQDDGIHTYASIKFPLLDEYGRPFAVCGISNDITERKQAEEALRKSEENFRMVFTNAAIGLMLADSQCVVIDCNQHFAKIFGASRQDYLGMNLLTTIPEGPVRQHLSDMLTDDLVHHYEGPYISQLTGKELYLAISSQRVTAGHVIIIINDITGRRQAEKELHVTRFMVEHASDALFWITPDARIVDANEAGCRSLGYSKDELLQLSVPDVDVYYDADTWPDHFAELRRSGSLKFESVQRARDGRLIPVEIVANYIQFDDIEFNCAFVRDISDRKQSEAKLENLTQRLQLAASSAYLGIWDWNVKENTMVWDDRMFELYGIKREAFPNSIDAWMNGLHPEDKKAAIEECQAALNGEKEFDTEFRVLHPDGTVKYIRGKGLVLRGADGNAERMLGINYDNTKAKYAEEEKYKLESQLLQAQKMESVGRLAGGVAHDFNNMLSVIMGHAELGLMHLEPTSPVCIDLKEISKTAERSADLTRQLLAFARKQTVAPKVIDLNDTVTSMLKMLQRLIGEDIQLVWQPSPYQCKVKMDPSQIDQILANLCVNARDAIADTGRITIETVTCSIDADYSARNPEATPGEYVRLVVSDSGKGMDRETLIHIFEPFYTTKEMGKGTGLGLATVYGAVKQNNGFINIHSEPGKGTTFSIHLPHYSEDTIRKQAELNSHTVPRGKETILLVEDEAAILNITAIMLEKQGYTVLRADSPGLAMELAREHYGAIHLLMTDVIMPEMNGRDLARNILTIHPGMKRLFMSGYTADVIAHHGVLDDGVHFIQKPFSMPNMAAKVREVLDKP